MDESATTRVTVEEAARLLGIEKQSVKKRIQRGKLRSERDASGTLYVWVDRSETVQDESATGPETVRDELVDELRSRVRYLEGQLDIRTEELREHRRLLAGLIERVPELEAPAAPVQEPAHSETASEAAQEPAGEPPGPAPQPPDPEAHRGSERVSWWRRMFG